MINKYNNTKYTKITLNQKFICGSTKIFTLIINQFMFKRGKTFHLKSVHNLIIIINYQILHIKAATCIIRQRPPRVPEACYHHSNTWTHWLCFLAKQKNK